MATEAAREEAKAEPNDGMNIDHTYVFRKPHIAGYEKDSVYLKWQNEEKKLKWYER